jgi:hypothetical protein
MRRLHCRRCGLAIRLSAGSLGLGCCPRCLAQDGKSVALMVEPAGAKRTRTGVRPFEQTPPPGGWAA